MQSSKRINRGERNVECLIKTVEGSDHAIAGLRGRKLTLSKEITLL